MNLSMKPEMKGKVKFAGWGVAIGAVVVMIIGFAWGGWMTQGTASKMTEEAVLATQSAICVAQFMKQTNHEEKLKELGKEEYYKRSGFIEKGGWDKMPGQEKAGSYVAQACAKGLEVLISK
jgi:hypothetical protein